MESENKQRQQAKHPRGRKKSKVFRWLAALTITITTISVCFTKISELATISAWIQSWSFFSGNQIAVVQTRLIPQTGLFSPSDMRDCFFVAFQVKNITSKALILSAMDVATNGGKNIKFWTEGKGDGFLSPDSTNNAYISLQPGEEKLIRFSRGLQMLGISDFLSKRELEMELCTEIGNGAIIHNQEWVRKLEDFVQSSYGKDGKIKVTFFEAPHNPIGSLSVPLAKGGLMFQHSGLICYDYLLGDSHFQLEKDRRIHWK